MPADSVALLRVFGGPWWLSLRVVHSTSLLKLLGVQAPHTWLLGLLPLEPGRRGGRFGSVSLVSEREANREPEKEVRVLRAGVGGFPLPHTSFRRAQVWFILDGPPSP